MSARGWPTFAGALLACAVTAAPAAAQNVSSSQMERGRYLTQAGNCEHCHTEDGGEPFAGGRGLGTPFGTIYAPNITFDENTGLGRWSRDDFYRAMHEGRAPDGSRYYPAFPYPYFTLMAREDVDAVYDYLQTLPRVRKEDKENDLLWPLHIRTFMIGWNMLFFEPGEFDSDPEKSEAWNRGAYLVEGAAHCGACHTGKNALGGDKDSEHLQGGLLDNWFAPDIRAGRFGGLSDWTDDEIVAYLKTGRNAHASAFSSMAEVIEYSTQYLTEPDLAAIATYLRDLESAPPEDVTAAPANVADAGAAIYADLCQACHVADGSGVAHIFTPLAGSGKVVADDPTTVIRVILEGARAVATDAYPSPIAMPAFDWKLTDAEIASVATYVRQSWGNTASVVTEGDVESIREALRPQQE